MKQVRSYHLDYERILLTDTTWKERLLLHSIAFQQYCNRSGLGRERITFELLTERCSMSIRMVKKHCKALEHKRYLRLVNHQGTKVIRFVLILPKHRLTLYNCEVSA